MVQAYVKMKPLVSSIVSFGSSLCKNESTYLKHSFMPVQACVKMIPVPSIVLFSFKLVKMKPGPSIVLFSFKLVKK
jgi:predicted permease